MWYYVIKIINKFADLLLFLATKIITSFKQEQFNPAVIPPDDIRTMIAVTEEKGVVFNDTTFFFTPHLGSNSSRDGGQTSLVVLCHLHISAYSVRAPYGRPSLRTSVGLRHHCVPGNRPLNAGH